MFTLSLFLNAPFRYGVCMIFIFGVLVEFALVNSHMRRSHKFNSMSQNTKWPPPPPPATNMHSDEETPRMNGHHKSAGPGLVPNEFAYRAMYHNRKALAVDQISRVAFPGIENVFFINTHTSI